MTTHAKSYHKVTCPDCAESRMVRTDTKATWCRSCKAKRRTDPYYIGKNTTTTPSIANYKAAHKWIGENKPKRHVCSICSKEAKTQWAYTEGNLRDLDSYIELCGSCHVRFDRRRVAVFYKKWGEK